MRAHLDNQPNIHNYRGGLMWIPVKELMNFSSATSGKPKDLLSVTKPPAKLTLQETVAWFMERVKSTAETIGIHEFLNGKYKVPYKIEEMSEYQKKAEAFYREKMI